MHAADKAALRRRFAAARAARSPADLAQARSAIRAHVLARQAELGWATVAAYVPLRSEPGSPELLSELADRGVRVLVPVVLPDRDLDWVEWDDTHPADPMVEVDGGRARLGRAALGAADAVLVPAFAVTPTGVRLGRGGGSYDRALDGLAPATELAALVFDDEVVAELPVDPWDRPVRTAVTPGGWIELDGNATVGQDG